MTRLIREFSPTRLLILMTLSLFFVAFSLRLMKLLTGYPFADDHARDVRIVMEHIEESKPFVLGPKASVGNIFVQPLYYYLIAIPLWVSQGNPVSASLLVVFVDSLTPVLLLAIGMIIFSKSAGFLMGLLYALSPFAIIYGSFAWSPNLVSFATTASVLGILMYLYKQNNAGAILASIFAIGAFHMHFQGLVVLGLVGCIAVYSVLFRKQSIKPWLLSVGIFVLSFTPIVFNLSVGVGNLQEIYRYFTQEQASYFQTTRTLEFLWNNIPRSFEVSLGFTSDGYMVGRSILVLGFVTGIIAGFKRWLQSRSIKGVFWIPPEWLLVLFYGVSIVGLRIYKGDKLDYYLLFMLYLPLLLLGLIWNEFRSRWFRVGTLIVLFGIVLNMGLHHPYAQYIGYSLADVRSNQDISFISEVVERTIQQYPTVQHGPVLYEFYREPIEYVSRWEFDLQKRVEIDSDRFVMFCSPEQCCMEFRCIAGCNSTEMISFLTNNPELSVVPRSSIKLTRIGRSIEAVEYEDLK